MEHDDRAFQHRKGQPLVWYHRNPARSNWFCPYCGTLVGPGSTVVSDQEHLIGRKFVPVGFMGGDSFNFIFRSCKQCNARKSAVEGHVSSVSLFNSRGRAEDMAIDSLAMRKASKQLHPGRIRGTVVQDALVEEKVEFDPAPGVKMSFTFFGPPQLDKASVIELAEMQVQGFFSMVTTEDPRVPEKTRILPRDSITIFGYYPDSDWGNPQLLELTRRTWDWQCRLLATSAKGYFKAVLKRSSASEDGWFWALEWNRFVRVVGGIFRIDAPPTWVEGLPGLGWQRLPDGSGRARVEVPVLSAEDRLFSCREDFSE